MFTNVDLCFRRYKRKEDVEELVSMKPRFLSKLKPQEGLREGNNAHFECKLEPVADSNLKVEWFKNGKPVTVGHRFRPIHDFGYVALDIIGLISEDSGVYTCRAVNAVGSDEVHANLSCKSSKQIVQESQGDVKMDKIQQIEDRSNYKISRHEELEESCTQVNQLHPLTSIGSMTENENHCIFMLKLGSRFHIIAEDDRNQGRPTSSFRSPFDSRL